MGALPYNLSNFKVFPLPLATGIENVWASFGIGVMLLRLAAKVFTRPVTAAGCFIGEPCPRLERLSLQLFSSRIALVWSSLGLNGFDSCGKSLACFVSRFGRSRFLLISENN